MITDEKEFMSEEEAYRTIDCCISDFEDIKQELPPKLFLGEEIAPAKVIQDGYYTYKGVKIPVIIQEERYKEGIL